MKRATKRILTVAIGLVTILSMTMCIFASSAYQSYYNQSGYTVDCYLNVTSTSADANMSSSPESSNVLPSEMLTCVIYVTAYRNDGRACTSTSGTCFVSASTSCGSNGIIYASASYSFMGYVLGGLVSYA